MAAARVFAVSGDPTALALPDCLLLAAGRPHGEDSPRLAEMWTDIEGGFSCDHTEVRRPVTDSASRTLSSGVYLPVAGPLAELAARARGFFAECLPLPFEAAIGFYLGRAGAVETDLETLGKEIVECPFQWWSCKLGLLHFEGDLVDFRDFKWREVASSWRPKRRGHREKLEDGPETR